VSKRIAFAFVFVVAFAASGCRAPVARPASPASSAGPASLLACLGAPADAIYDPGRLAAPPARGLAVHTFEQTSSRCGPIERRYLAYVPERLGARTAAPVVIVLHGQGGNAEAMMSFQTRGTFNTLADAKGFVVVYGNGAPTSFNFPGLPNSGRWRAEGAGPDAEVNDLDYLARVIDDLAARGVIAGPNDVYLVGQSNGGGMALAAARLRPNSYRGVAAFMPYVGFDGADTPPSFAGTRLRRVLLADSARDPGLPPGYADRVLAPLARAWAGAMGVSGATPTETAIPDSVKEDGGAAGGSAAVEATRDSTAKRVDLRSPTGAFRHLVFDRAGHFWPTRQPVADPPPVLARFGLRNRDVEGAEEVWDFFSTTAPDQ